MSKFNLQFFGTETGTGAAAGTPTSASTGTEISGNAKDADKGKTFTQADVDKLITDRLTRERKKYEGFDELKAKAAKFDELESSNKTELEKAEARAKVAEDKVAVLTAQITARDVEILKKEALVAVGLPTTLWQRVAGSTAEEITADVAELQKIAGGTTTAKPGTTIGTKTGVTVPTNETPQERGKRLAQERHAAVQYTGANPWASKR
jgi:hypothetical protein